MKTQEELEREFKQCSICKIYKRFTEFSKCNQKKDGLRQYCNDCNNIRQRSYYKKYMNDPEVYEKRRTSVALYMQRKRNDPSYVAKEKECTVIYPERARARAKLRRNVSNGKIKKLPCQICGDYQSEGHHEDYSKPLDVIWLCRTHHLEIHRKFNTIRERLGLPEHDREI